MKKDRVGEIWQSCDNIGLVITSGQEAHIVHSLTRDVLQVWHESTLHPWEQDDRMTRLA